MSTTQSIGAKILDLEIDVAGLTRSLNTNLRLLDLDLASRAARITPLTFSNRDKAQNQGQRIRTAEWVLYRLFEIYDRKETQKRLQPFYPEIIQRQSQRQSLDLRAGVYKWLAELKQTGLLPKDMIVRKTMLDDCKGERFVKLIWELSCLALHVTVARNTHDKSVVKKMLVVSAETGIEARAAIGCAYRNSLNRVLEEKSALATRYRDFGEELDSNKAKLRAREKALGNESKLWKQKSLSESLLQRLELNLNEEWEGNLAWVDVLLHGDQHRRTNCLLERPFEQVWPLVENGTVKDVQPQATQSLLQNLESRLEEQKARLEKWKVVQEDLTIASASPNKSPSKSPSKTPMRCAKTPARTPSRTNRVISSRSNITPLHRRALSLEKPSRTAMSAVSNMPTTLEETPQALDLPPKITPLERTSFRQAHKPSLISTRREPGVVSLDRSPKTPVGRFSSLRWPPNPEPAVPLSRDIPVDTKLTATKPQRAPSYQKHVRAESAPHMIKPFVSGRSSDIKTPQRVSSLRQPSPVKVTDKSVASIDGKDEKLEQGPMISRPINVNPATRSSVHMEEPAPQILLRDPRKLVSIVKPKPTSSLDEDDADLESLEMELPSQVFSPSESSPEGILAELEKPSAHAASTKADLPQMSLQSHRIGKMTENANNVIPRKHLLSLAERTRMSMSKSSPTRESLDPFEQPGSRSQKISEQDDTNSHPSTHAPTMPTAEPRSLAERTRMSMAKLSPTKEKTNPLETQALKPDSAPTTDSHTSAHLPYNSSSSVSTLAERTRLSIARLSPTKELSNPFDKPVPTPPTLDPSASTLCQPSTDPYLALQARTRLSLLESAAKAPQRRASMRKAARASRQYPVNQWDDEELPAVGSHARLNSVAEGTTGDAGLEDMDYESVFASRPKLGLGSSAAELKRGEGSGLGKEGADLDQVDALDEKGAFASRPRIGLGDGVN